MQNYISQAHHIYICCMYTTFTVELYLTGTSYFCLLHVYYLYCRTISHSHIIFISDTCILSLLQNYISQAHHFYNCSMYAIFTVELYLAGTSYFYLLHVYYLYCRAISHRNFIFIYVACILSLLQNYVPQAHYIYI